MSRRTSDPTVVPTPTETQYPTQTPTPTVSALEASAQARASLGRVEHAAEGDREEEEGGGAGEGETWETGSSGEQERDRLGARGVEEEKRQNATPINAVDFASVRSSLELSLGEFPSFLPNWFQTKPARESAPRSGGELGLKASFARL